jgi:hypothetical protein
MAPRGRARARAAAASARGGRGDAAATAERRGKESESSEAEEADRASDSDFEEEEEGEEEEDEEDEEEEDEEEEEEEAPRKKAATPKKRGASASSSPAAPASRKRKRKEYEFSRADMEQAFRLLDANGHGHLELADLRTATEKTKQDIPTEELRDMLHTADQRGDRDGRVTLRDFLKITADAELWDGKGLEESQREPAASPGAPQGKGEAAESPQGGEVATPTPRKRKRVGEKKTS